jgi:FkbM family methyltransferase
MQWSDPEDADRRGRKRTTDPRPAGFRLGVWRRLSLGLAKIPRLRKSWTVASRGLRQFWAGRVAWEVWAPLPGGVGVPARLWDHVEAGIFWYGFPAEDIAAFQVLSSAVPRDGVVLDIGANIGAFALPLAAVADRGTIHCFEPASATAARLRRNIELNGIDNIVVNECGVSDHAGPMSIWIPETRWKGRLYNTGMSSRYVGKGRQGWREESVRCIRLDDYLTAHELRRIDAIKLDVEGGELDVLAGARSLIHRLRPLVVMEVNRVPLAAAGRSVDDVLQFWRENDYRVGMITAAGRVRWGRHPTAAGGHQNICCAPA